MIETLEDMLREVKKFDKNAYICDDKMYILGNDYIVQIDDKKWFKDGCDRWALVIGTINSKRDIEYLQYIREAALNPHDILDIIRSMANCGKPESEKVIDNEWIEYMECCHNCNNYDFENQWCRELDMSKSESERCDYCDTEKEKVK